MAKNIRFWSSMAKTKLRPELDGQKWTFFYFFSTKSPFWKGRVLGQKSQNLAQNKLEL